jgi:ATP-dependent helicase/nuclease subunit A
MSKQPPAPLSDAAARREAMTTPHHAFVWASAGTGKTHTLALRALYLLLNAPFLSPEEGDVQGPAAEIGSLYSASSRQERLKSARAIIGSLILTTFTRKAAAEMQTRLYQYLEIVTEAESLSHLETEDPLFYEIIRTVLNNLESGKNLPLFAGLEGEDSFHRLQVGAQALSEQAAELQISTIHSFAASILRRHPLQAGIPPTARFAREDEDDLLGLEDQVLERWWQQKVLSDPQLQKELAQLLTVVPLRHIRLWLTYSYESRWMAEESEALPLKNEKRMQELVDAGAALVRALAKGGGTKIVRKRDQFDQILQDITSGQKGAFRELCDFILQAKRDLFLHPKITKTVRGAIEGLAPEHSRYFQSWTDFYVPALRICLAQEFAPTWAVWTRFLGRFVDWAEEAAMRELGLVTFDEMIRLAVRLLEQHPAIRRAEQAKLRALLVDEFQDTDPDQLRLFKALLKRDPEDPHEVLGFFVGDTKQSIYRFRSADVPSILDFCRRYESHTGCQLKQTEFRLKTSFRSVKAVTRFVNHFFEKELTLASEDEALVPFRSDEEVLPEWIFTDTDEEGRNFNVDQGRSYAAAQTLEMIQEYLESSTSEQPPYKDILVLVRDWRQVDTLLPVLQNAGIPVISSGAKTFYRQPEVLDLLNLLIALLHPQDRLAVAAVLRGPLLYLSDPQLHDLLKEIPPERLFHSQEPLPESLPEEVRAGIEHLRKLAAGRLESTLSEWLGEVRAFIPMALYTQPGDREGRPLVRIARVLENFKEAMEMTVIPPLVWLLKQRTRAAESGRWDSNNPGEDITVATESVDAVRVMTIHKAKGLEGRFTIVYGWSSVLSDLGNSPAKWKNPEVISLTDDEGQKVQAFSLQWGPLKIVSSSYSEALKQERKGVRAEAERLAYVAATRARDRMALLCPRSKHRPFPEGIQDFIGSAKRKIPAGSQGGQADICNGHLRFIHRPGFDITPPEVPPPSVSFQEDAYQSLWKKRYLEFKSSHPSLLRHPSDPEHREEGEIREDHQYPGKVDRETGLLAGRLAHTYLERYLLHDAFEPNNLSVCLGEIPGGTFDAKVIKEVEKVLSQFYSGKLVDTSGRPYQARVQAARVLGREIPVYLQDEGQAWHGIIDLVLEEEETIRAIDYKTTAQQDPLPETYLRQERIYSEALRRLFPDQDVSFEFWWLK